MALTFVVTGIQSHHLLHRTPLEFLHTFVTRYNALTHYLAEHRCELDPPVSSVVAAISPEPSNPAAPRTMAGGKTYSAAEVAKHNKADDCWIVVDGVVYDVTKFLSDHPGGKKVIVAVAGQDASKKFHLFHKPSVMQKYGPGLDSGQSGRQAVVAAADRTYSQASSIRQGASRCSRSKQCGARAGAGGNSTGGAGKGEHPPAEAVSVVKQGNKPGADRTADGKSADSGKGQDSSKDSAKLLDADKAGQSNTRISSQEAEQQVKEQRAAEARKSQLSGGSAQQQLILVILFIRLFISLFVT